MSWFYWDSEQSKHKPNKLWVDQGREYYNKRMHKWIGDNDILIYLTHNQDKSVVADRFVRTLIDKIYKTIINFNNFLFE